MLALKLFRMFLFILHYSCKLYYVLFSTHITVGLPLRSGRNLNTMVILNLTVYEGYSSKMKLELTGAAALEVFDTALHKNNCSDFFLKLTCTSSCLL